MISGKCLTISEICGSAFGMGIVFALLSVDPMDPSALLLAQDASPVVSSHVNCTVEVSSYSSWSQKTALARGVRYLADHKRTQHVLANYSKLKLEMSLDEVKKLLGEPDFGSARPPLHLASQPEPEDRRCSLDVAFIIRKSNRNMLDNEDVAIFLSFTRAGKLYWAMPQNLEGLKQLGSPTTGASGPGF